MNQKQIFNYRLSWARPLVECTLGILTAKLRIFTTCIQVNPDAIDDVVKAWVVLHNFVLLTEPLVMDNQDTQSTLVSLTTSGLRFVTAVNQMRDRFAVYFLSCSG